MVDVYPIESWEYPQHGGLYDRYAAFEEDEFAVLQEAARARIASRERDKLEPFQLDRHIAGYAPDRTWVLGNEAILPRFIGVLEDFGRVGRMAFDTDTRVLAESSREIATSLSAANGAYEAFHVPGFEISPDMFDDTNF